MPSANDLHSLSEALSQFTRFAERINTVFSGVQDVLASAGFSAGCAAAPVQAPMFSATGVAVGARCPSPTPLPKRASKCRPPLAPGCMRLSASSTSAPPAACGRGRGGAGPLASYLLEPKFTRSPFTVEGCATGLARVISSVAAPARHR